MKFEKFTTDTNSVTQWQNQIVWSIDNFMELIDQHKKIHSPNFTHCNNDFSIGQLSVVTFLDINLRKQWVKISLKFKISNPVQMEYACSIINKEGQKMLSSKFYMGFEKPSENYVAATIEKSKFYVKNGNEQLTNDGKLIISCNIRLFPVAKRNENLLFNDFGKLLNNDNLTDVTIAVGKNDFRAHRIILMARSEYFKDILLDGKEDINEITLFHENVDEFNFNIILNYIYSDFIDRHILAAKSNELLIVAHMLKLNGLKELCEMELRETLTIHSAPLYLEFGELYSAKILKKASIDFISAFLKYVIETESWKSLIISHPHLVIEVTLPKAKLCKCFRTIINNYK